MRTNRGIPLKLVVQEVERACKAKKQALPYRIRRLLRLAQIYGASDKNMDDCLDYDEFCDLVSVILLSELLKFLTWLPYCSKCSWWASLHVERCCPFPETVRLSGDLRKPVIAILARGFECEKNKWLCLLYGSMQFSCSPDLNPFKRLMKSAIVFHNRYTLVSWGKYGVWDRFLLKILIPNVRRIPIFRK